MYQRNDSLTETILVNNVIKKEKLQKTTKSTQTTEIKTTKQKALKIMEISNYNTNGWECFCSWVRYQIHGCPLNHYVYNKKNTSKQT